MPLYSHISCSGKLDIFATYWWKVFTPVQRRAYWQVKEVEVDRDAAVAVEMFGYSYEYDDDTRAP